MKIYVDIDNTICLTEEFDYENALPLYDRIKLVNSLYDEGHIIVLWTARGTVSGTDYSQLTKMQLEVWGVKYTKLKFGKPDFDIFIDDKAINSRDMITMFSPNSTIENIIMDNCYGTDD